MSGEGSSSNGGEGSSKRPLDKAPSSLPRKVPYGTLRIRSRTPSPAREEAQEKVIVGKGKEPYRALRMRARSPPVIDYGDYEFDDDVVDVDVKEEDEEDSSTDEDWVMTDDDDDEVVVTVPKEGEQESKKEEEQDKEEKNNNK
ncbi:unnamed protein product [Cochlearia groenlandica]